MRNFEYRLVFVSNAVNDLQIFFDSCGFLSGKKIKIPKDEINETMSEAEVSKLMSQCLHFLLLLDDHVSFPLQIDLMSAFRRGDLGDFIYALEFFKADVNEVDDSGLTVFQRILQTPNSGEFIKSSVNNGADCYGVRG